MESYNGKICAFFGHALICENAENLKFLYQETKKQAEFLILNENVDTFLYGGYGEFDKLAVKIAFELQKKYPNIKIYLVLAYFNQLQRDEPYFIFNDILYIEGLEKTPPRFAICRRNEWIAKKCDFVISYVKTETGGAYTATKAAKRAKKIVIDIADLLERQV